MLVGLATTTAEGPTPTIPATWYAFVLLAPPLAMMICASLTVVVAALLGAKVS